MTTINCSRCLGHTSESYAKAHKGLCKACAIVTRNANDYPCPDCETGRITAYQKTHGYHCDGCTRVMEQGF